MNVSGCGHVYGLFAQKLALLALMIHPREHSPALAGEARRPHLRPRCRAAIGRGVLNARPYSRRPRSKAERLKVLPFFPKDPASFFGGRVTSLVSVFCRLARLSCRDDSAGPGRGLKWSSHVISGCSIRSRLFPPLRAR